MQRIMLHSQAAAHVADLRYRAPEHRGRRSGAPARHVPESKLAQTPVDTRASIPFHTQHAQVEPSQLVDSFSVASQQCRAGVGHKLLPFAPFGHSTTQPVRPHTGPDFVPAGSRRRKATATAEATLHLAARQPINGPPVKHKPAAKAVHTNIAWVNQSELADEEDGTVATMTDSQKLQARLNGGLGVLAEQLRILDPHKLAAVCAQAQHTAAATSGPL